MWKFTVKPGYQKSPPDSRGSATNALVSGDEIVEAVRALSHVWHRLSEPIRKLIEHINVGWTEHWFSPLQKRLPCPYLEFIFDEKFDRNPDKIEWDRPIMVRTSSLSSEFSGFVARGLLRELIRRVGAIEKRNRELSDEMSRTLDGISVDSFP